MTATGRQTKTSRFVGYTTYRFGQKAKDPVIDMVKTAMEDHGYDIKRLHEESGVAASTYFNWFDGPTRQPKHASVAATIGAMGLKFAIVPARQRANGHALDAAAPQFIKRFKSAAGA